MKRHRGVDRVAGSKVMMRDVLNECFEWAGFDQDAVGGRAGQVMDWVEGYGEYLCEPWVVFRAAVVMDGRKIRYYRFEIVDTVKAYVASSVTVGRFKKQVIVTTNDLTGITEHKRRRG